MSRRLGVFGSTGSVGVSTLDLLAQARARGAEFELSVLTAGRNVALLAEQALAWRPERAVIADPTLQGELNERLKGSGVRVEAGEAAVAEAAELRLDWIMAAIVGAAGLRPTLAAARTGAVIALANKESLVCAGPALLAAAQASGGRVIPVDSEHSAIFQVLQPECHARLKRLILTASGGPFRAWGRERMAAASPREAVSHPNWSMGAKISVDSATMMNKGLEMIEASYLFAVPEPKIDVLVHPQSVVHSLVEYEDGSTLAQLGPPDMRAPIAYAFAYPERIAWDAPGLDLAQTATLSFEAPDPDRFPALRLARNVLSRGGGAPAALNAANEVAVRAFLEGAIGFLAIAETVERTLEAMDSRGELNGTLSNGSALDFALAVDALARTRAAEALAPSKTRNAV